MIVSEIKLYELLKAKIGEREAEAFLGLLESRVDQKFEERKNDFILEKDKERLLIKDDALAIFSTKQDIAESKSEIIKWMFVFIMGLLISISGIMVAILHAYLK